MSVCAASVMSTTRRGFSAHLKITTLKAFWTLKYQCVSLYIVIALKNVKYVNNIFWVESEENVPYLCNLITAYKNHSLKLMLTFTTIKLYCLQFRVLFIECSELSLNPLVFLSKAVWLL